MEIQIEEIMENQALKDDKRSIPLIEENDEDECESPNKIDNQEEEQKFFNDELS